MASSKYKICKHCGNRVHPRSRQCPWCGGVVRGSMGWFSTLCILVILAVVAGVVIDYLCNRPPSVSKLRLPRIEREAN